MLRLDRSENTNSAFQLRVLFKRRGSHLSCLTVPATFPALHHVNTRYIRMPMVTSVVIIHPAIVQQSTPYISSSSTDSADTASSLAAACLTSVIAAKALNARAMYSVSIVRSGAELGRPLMCLTLFRSESGFQRYPSRCFVSRSARLTATRIFSILSCWIFFCCCRSTWLSCFRRRRCHCGEPALVRL